MTPFIDLYKQTVARMSSGAILTRHGTTYSQKTVSGYLSSLAPMYEWEDNNGPLYLEELGPAWADQWMAFLMDLDYSKNTIAIANTRIKAILGILYKEGKCTYNGYGIKTVFEETTAVYSTNDDLQKLLDAQLTESRRQIRDMYVLNCFMGLRYADLLAFLANPRAYVSKVDGQPYLTMTVQKTCRAVSIPLSPLVIDVLDKNDWTFKHVSFQYYDRTIKEIASIAGITEPLAHSRTQGRGLRTEIRRKCDMMSSHTARRTFATNAFLAGIPEKSIMMITGHSTTVAFHRYIRATPLDSAIRIANHAFFNTNLKISKDETTEIPDGQQ